MRANRFANLLLTRGIGKGDKVAILLMNGIDWLPVYFGVLKTGALAVPLNYRYSSEEFGGYGVLEELRDQVVENETVYSISNDVITIYYIIRDNRCYRVYPTEQREGGTLSPARSILGLDEYLFFGTESGDLCLFNNDKRGVPPPSLLAQADFDEKEYLSRNARRIHSDFYDFDHHAPRYALAQAVPIWAICRLLCRRYILM